MNEAILGERAFFRALHECKLVLASPERSPNVENQNPSGDANEREAMRVNGPQKPKIEMATIQAIKRANGPLRTTIFRRQACRW
jgi:hypothetical protein